MTKKNRLFSQKSSPDLRIFGYYFFTKSLEKHQILIVFLDQQMSFFQIKNGYYSGVLRPENTKMFLFSSKNTRYYSVNSRWRKKTDFFLKNRHQTFVFLVAIFSLQITTIISVSNFPNFKLILIITFDIIAVDNFYCHI